MQCVFYDKKSAVVKHDFCHSVNMTLNVLQKVYVANCRGLSAFQRINFLNNIYNVARFFIIFTFKRLK